MKRCPECMRNYYDETLLYCLDDGSALLEGPGASGDEATRKLEISLPVNATATASNIEPATELLARPQATRTGIFPRSGILIAAVTVLGILGVGFALYRSFGGASDGRPRAPVRSVPLTSYTGVERNPAFSPDGRQIAFVWTGEKNDNFDIYVKLVDAGEPLRLTTNPAREMSPAWSPDGSFVAFVRTGSPAKGFYIVPALGGAERKVSDAFEFLEPGGVVAQFLDWSPDGKTLAVADKGSESEPRSIYLINIDSGERRRITEPPAHFAGDIHLAYSPDGSEIAFVRAQSGIFAEGQIYVMPAEGGEPRLVASDDWGIGSIAWARDGKSLIFSAGRAGNSALWRVSSSGGSPEIIPGVGENAGDVTVSRQTDRLVYGQLSIDIDIRKMDLTTQPNGKRGLGPATDVVATTRIEQFPRYSPDGGRVAYQSNRSGNAEMWICGSDGQNSIQLTTSGGITGAPHWSPDGRQLAYVGRSAGNSDIYVVSVEGGAPRRLTTEESEETTPSWSNDGQHIYFASRRTGRFEIWKMPAAGGDAVQITRNGGYNPIESSDGRKIFFSAHRNNSFIRSLDLTTGEEMDVVKVAVGSDNWAATERGIYYIMRPDPGTPHTVGFVELATGKTTELGSLGPQPREFLVSGVAISPDEKTILFAQRDRLEFDLVLVENF